MAGHGPMFHNSLQNRHPVTKDESAILQSLVYKDFRAILRNPDYEWSFKTRREEP